MAKATLHPALTTISGAQGGLVFRNVRGKTVIARRPSELAKKHAPSKAQLAQRKRFAAAGYYAHEVLADACQRRVYEALALAQNRRVDKLVASDFLTPPVVDVVDLSGYRGKAGEVIRVLATDDVEVVSVLVAIETEAGARLEAGAASKVHGVWRYTATVAAPSAQRVTITATAQDRPGHEGTGRASYP